MYREGQNDDYNTSRRRSWEVKRGAPPRGRRNYTSPCNVIEVAPPVSQGIRHCYTAPNLGYRKDVLFNLVVIV